METVPTDKPGQLTRLYFMRQLMRDRRRRVAVPGDGRRGHRHEGRPRDVRLRDAGRARGGRRRAYAAREVRARSSASWRSRDPHRSPRLPAARRRPDRVQQAARAPKQPSCASATRAKCVDTITARLRDQARALAVPVRAERAAGSRDARRARRPATVNVHRLALRSVCHQSVGGTSRQLPPDQPAQRVRQARTRDPRRSARAQESLRRRDPEEFSLAAACIIFVLLGAPIALRFPRGGVGLVIGVSSRHLRDLLRGSDRWRGAREQAATLRRSGRCGARTSSSRSSGWCSSGAWGAKPRRRAAATSAS